MPPGTAGAGDCEAADGGPRRPTVLLERAAATLALGRLLDRDRESLERQTHRTLLSGILTHALTVSDVALRARALGVPLAGRRLVGVMLRQRGGPPSAALEAQARLRDFTESAASAVRERGLVALTGALDDGAVGVLVSLNPHDEEQPALDGLAAALKSGPPFLMAAGSCVGALRSDRRGGPARRPGRRHVPRLLPAARHPAARLLHLLRDDARLQTYVERELGPLLTHDAEHGTDLVRILGGYLAAGRNKSAAADAVHLSRPSFYDRLHRVERVLGVDLDQVESCPVAACRAARPGGGAALSPAADGAYVAGRPSWPRRPRLHPASPGFTRLHPASPGVCWCLPAYADPVDNRKPPFSSAA